MALQHDFHRRMIFKMNPEGRCVDTPSGPQWAFNEDQANLAELLYLSTCVSDFVIAPEIGTHQQNPCAALFDLYSPHLRTKGPDYDIETFDMRSRYLVILQTEGGPSKESLDMTFIQNWCGENRAKAYLIPVANLHGTILDNACRLSPSCRIDPDLEGEGMNALMELLRSGNHTVTKAITAMTATGDSEEKVRHDIERAVANQFIMCDLTVPFTDQSILRYGESTEFQNFYLDPVMAIITSGEELW